MKNWYVMYVGDEGLSHVDEKMHTEEKAMEIYNQEADDGCNVALYCIENDKNILKLTNYEG